jgi:hypothetical protein
MEKKEVTDLTMLNKAQACDYYNVGYSTLLDMDAAGVIPGITVGSRRYYPPYLTKKALEKRMEGGADEAGAGGGAAVDAGKRGNG